MMRRIERPTYVLLILAYLAVVSTVSLWLLLRGASW